MSNECFWWLGDNKIFDWSPYVFGVFCSPIISDIKTVWQLLFCMSHRPFPILLPTFMIVPACMRICLFVGHAGLHGIYFLCSVLF